jgi:ATP-dependent DNA helicase UvrD/PcrA
MSDAKPMLEKLWRRAGFSPDCNQRRAIEHAKGPLFLTAGPGSGKTRVLLWRTVNLIVCRGIKPKEIFLSTFTEKASRQLQEGLRALLEYASEHTRKVYDLSGMYIGTIHSLCQRIIEDQDRRFSGDGIRQRPPLLMDDLSQYLYVYNNRRWSRDLVSEWPNANVEINRYLSDGQNSSRRPIRSRHQAVWNAIGLFNRFSEECLDPLRLRRTVKDRTLRHLVEAYAKYRKLLQGEEPARTDFSLLQQAALGTLKQVDRDANTGAAGRIFKYIMIDEYQDTNTIQEKLIFKLASGHKNLCVVGDDDQALYRFRGATVENFVQFRQRCKRYLGVAPKEVALDINYRSRERIVDFYSEFMKHPSCPWQRNGKKESYYRVQKHLKAHRKDDGISVVSNDRAEPAEVCAEIAAVVKKIIKTRKVENPNQIAFLYPSLGFPQVLPMMRALERQGLKVYAPRARTFLEVDEAKTMLGLFLRVFGKPLRNDNLGRDLNNYEDWMDAAFTESKSLIDGDSALRRYVYARKREIDEVLCDYEVLQGVVKQRRWDLDDDYDPDKMGLALRGNNNLSRRAKKTLASPYVERLIKNRRDDGRPFKLKYIIARATSLDWNVLDLFYHLCGFRHFRRMFDKAENAKKDEGPVCNLSLLSQYLARFNDEYHRSVLSAESLKGSGFKNLFFRSYLYALYRRGEAEYEDAQDPFPRGRIPFLTIHQAKGLEFPVVVLGNPWKKHHKPQRVEVIVRRLLEREGEPLDRIATFDAMRMFYVALSRAKNLLVIAHYRRRAVSEPFKCVLNDEFNRIRDFKISDLLTAEPGDEELPKTYSYTGDFLMFKRCPRQYMAFRKYRFAPSRVQTGFFGNLVHSTIEDLHRHLRDLRRRSRA